MSEEETKESFVKITVDEVDTEFYFKLDNKYCKRAVCYFLTLLTSILGFAGFNTAIISRNPTNIQNIEKTEVGK